MSSEIVGMPPPRERPDRPLPPELAGSCAHGYNCRCVARHFGLDLVGYGEVPACALSAADYNRLAAEAGEVQERAKRLGAQRETGAALVLYSRMRQLAAQLDRTGIELAAVSDLAELFYAAGDLSKARQCADAVRQAASISLVAVIHFGQYAELRLIEGSQDVAEKVLISLCTEEGDLDQARALIAHQRERIAGRQAHPEQFPPDQLDGTYELELQIFEVRVLIAAADLATARDRIDPIIAELATLSGERAESLLAMARGELVRLRQDGGQDAVADLVRMRARLSGDVAAAAKVDVQLAWAQAAGGDLARAVRTIVESRDRLAAAGLAGDMAEASFALGTILLSVGEISQARTQFDHAASVWTATGDAQGPDRLDFVLAQCDAAEHDWESALHHAERARDAARASGAWLACVRADFLTAVVLRASGAVRAALEWLLPAALAADEYRFRFPTAAARTAWARAVAAPAMELAMAMLTQLGESRLLAEMIERTCSVGSFTEQPRAAQPVDVTSFAAPPPVAEDDRQLPLAALAAVTASLPLRLAPPPPLRWSPTSPMQLRHWLDLAADRYGLSPAAAAEVPTW